MATLIGNPEITNTPEISSANLAVDSPTFDDAWAPLHNFEIWRTSRDGTYGTECNDATGCSYGE